MSRGRPRESKSGRKNESTIIPKRRQGFSGPCGLLSEIHPKLLEAPVLGYQKDRDQYTLTTDASLTGIGAILTQKQGTEDRVFAYASKTLSKSQRNYSATKRELIAIVHFTHYFKNYLLGQHYLIITNHRALVRIYSFKEPYGRKIDRETWAI